MERDVSHRLFNLQTGYVKFYSEKKHLKQLIDTEPKEF